MKNENMGHGLFGKLEPGVVTEFEDWKDVAKLSYANSKKRIVMYRSVVSFAEDTAKELLLKDQKNCNGRLRCMGERATHIFMWCSGTSL